MFAATAVAQNQAVSIPQMLTPRRAISSDPVMAASAAAINAQVHRIIMPGHVGPNQPPILRGMLFVEQGIEQALALLA